MDENTLYGALQDGEIAGTGFDVMADEPVHKSPLFELDSVVVTPHVAWYSERSLGELVGRLPKTSHGCFQKRNLTVSSTGARYRTARSLLSHQESIVVLSG